MSVHGEAVAAYKTLAEYLQKNCVRAMGRVCHPFEICEKCPFLYRGFTCLIHRLGNYPGLALEDDAIEGINAKTEELEREEKTNE